jgi:hypothetical protein
MNMLKILPSRAISQASASLFPNWPQLQRDARRPAQIVGPGPDIGPEFWSAGITAQTPPCAMRSITPLEQERRRRAIGEQADGMGSPTKFCGFDIEQNEFASRSLVDIRASLVLLWCLYVIS